MNRVSQLLTLCCALTACAAPAILSAKVLYVKQGASGAHNGTCWADAYTSPHEAFTEALPGDQVWVAEGTYHPGAPGQVDATFLLPSGVELYGGFAGAETQLSERDWLSHPTVLSGDLADDDVFGNPWWSGWNITTPNSKRILAVSGNTGSSTIDGLVFGNASGTYTVGAGIYSQGGQIAIRNCTFRRNSSYQTAGTCVAVDGGQATIAGCTFSENWGRFVDGVGIWTGGNAGVTITKCHFYDNHADAYISNGNGAGIALAGTSPSFVSECEFLSNVAVVWPGVQYPSYGGGIYSFGSVLSVDRCKFRGNSASNGGGIFSWKSLSVSNCLFANNSADYGGALSTYSYQDYDLRVIGCTVVNNSAHEVGGVAFGGYATYTSKVSGCILWGNSDVGGIHSRGQIKEATYSCIQNLWVALPGEDPIDPEKFPNCIDSNPTFVQNGIDYRLRHSSPCVDAADKTEFDPALLLDFGNMARFVDLLSAPDVGFGTPPLPDMGCYEAYAMVELPTSFLVATGTLVAGGLNQLLSSDDQWLRVRPSFSGSRLDPNIVVETVHACSVTSPTGLKFSAELSATAGPNDVKLQAFNHSTQSWETLNSGVSGSQDIEYLGNVSSNCGRFISEGQVRVRCWIKAQGSNGARSWEGRIDRVSVEIVP